MENIRKEYVETEHSRRVPGRVHLTLPRIPENIRRNLEISVSQAKHPG